jgi:hypothetical protein
MSKDLFNFKSADFSPCRKYRYTLWRWWDENKPYAMFICLNPSTADETKDDPTIRRCINFAKSWGYGGLCVTNLFALRATDPRVMLASFEPIGIDNDKWIQELAKKAGIIIAAWGTYGNYLNRDKQIIEKINNLNCLEKTKHGHPKHPLYIKADTIPVGIHV